MRFAQKTGKTPDCLVLQKTVRLLTRRQILSQACVSSILELPLPAVPNFAAETDPYAALHAFLALRGLGFLKIELPQAAPESSGSTPPPPQLPFAPAGESGSALCVLAGPSPRGAHRHAVVGRAIGRRLEPVFDPHPDGGMLAGPPVWAGFFISVDPAQHCAPAPPAPGAQSSP
jgi:hypothetical protein